MANTTSHIEKDDMFSFRTTNVLLAKSGSGKTCPEHRSKAHSKVATRSVDHKLATPKLICFVKRTSIHCFIRVRYWVFVSLLDEHKFVGLNKSSNQVFVTFFAPIDDIAHEHVHLRLIRGAA